MRKCVIITPILLISLVLTAAIGCLRTGDDGFTTSFGLNNCRVLVPGAGNSYFSLQPGRFLKLEGEEDGEFVEVEITVLGETKRIPFELDGQPFLAIARIVEEHEWIDGETVEISRNYFATCQNSNNVFYLGEDVDIYKDGEIVSHDGAWLAGVDGALPGLIMPELFLLGARYYQEIAPKVALDRAEHVEMDMTVETPAGIFENCVLVIETTPLEEGEKSIKVYTPGIGLIIDDFLELVEYEL